MTHYATYSRSQDCFPDNAPKVFQSGKGCHVTADDGREFIDWGMALRSVILGYAYSPVDEAVKKAIDKGISFTRSNPYEGELKELLKAIIPCAEEVKFGKNGSDATSAAIKLARAYTGRDIVLIAKENPFISQHDWFIGTTSINDGIPYVENHSYLVDDYKYSTMAYGAFTIEDYLRSNPEKVAAIILDPSTVDITKKKLQYMRDLCDKYGIIMILDEVISGFRYSLNGVQGLYGVTPDLCTLGKAMGNGYSISALCGKKELFDLGLRGKGNVFLLSGTYFGCVDGLSSSIACINELQTWKSNLGESAHEYLKTIGNMLISGMNNSIKKHNLEEYAKMGGFSSCPMMQWKTSEALKAKTIFDFEMVERGFITPYWSPSLSHSIEIVKKTLSAIDESMEVLGKAIYAGNLDNYIKHNCGDWVEKPVFRRT